MDKKFYDLTFAELQSDVTAMELAINDAQDAIDVLMQMVVENGRTLTREQRNDLIELSSKTSVIAQEGYRYTDINIGG